MRSQLSQLQELVAGLKKSLGNLHRCKCQSSSLLRFQVLYQNQQVPSLLPHIICKLENIFGTMNPLNSLVTKIIMKMIIPVITDSALTPYNDLSCPGIISITFCMLHSNPFAVLMFTYFHHSPLRGLPNCASISKGGMMWANR